MSQQAHWRDVHKLIDRLLELVHSGTTTAEVAAHDLLQEVIPTSWIVLVHSTDLSTTRKMQLQSLPCGLHRTPPGLTPSIVLIDITVSTRNGAAG